MTDPYEVFLSPEARRINQARLEHLATLGLEIRGRTVLEVAAGIGLRTHFFEDRGCAVLSTDGAAGNVAEMGRRYPHRRIGVLDLDLAGDLSGLGTFDLVHCYGALHHLARPEAALAALGKICAGQILLETVVLPGRHPELQFVREPLVANREFAGLGCRPTRSWVLETLGRIFGHAYVTLDQPEHPDFATDWNLIGHCGTPRAVFVGSKTPLDNPNLSPVLVSRHRNDRQEPKKIAPRRIWIDVGAYEGSASLAAARADPDLEVHAFEPQPDTAARLMEQAPANYRVYAAAVSDREGMAVFRSNDFAAASSLLAMDEDVRRRWTGGEVLREAREIVVPTRRLDAFMAEARVGRVEFLKIDAQGADFQVLQSLGERLRDVRRIQLEADTGETPLYRGSSRPEDIIAFMSERGFRLADRVPQTHGQEENLVFESEAWREAEAFESLETLPNLLAFEDAAVVQGEMTAKDGWHEFTTGEAQWAYALVVPIQFSAQHQSSRVRLRLALNVEAGHIEIGILNLDESDFLERATVSAGRETEVELRTPELRRVGRLVLRNASAHGASRARCRVVAVEVEP